jgi:hypothetical protein
MDYYLIKVLISPTLLTKNQLIDGDLLLLITLTRQMKMKTKY